MGYRAKWFTTLAAIGVLAGGCDEKSTEEQSAKLTPSPGETAPSVAGPLVVPDDAPAYLATLESTAVLADFEMAVPALSHRLPVPKSWALEKKDVPASAAPFDARVLSVATRDASPGSPSVTVIARDVPFEVPVDGLMKHVVTGEGWAIERARWIPGKKGVYYDVTAVKTSGGIERVRRTTARAAEGRFFEVNALAARSDWDDVKEIFWAAGAGFEQHSGAGQTRAEVWRRYEGQSPSFELAYPESWQPEQVPAPSGDISAVNLRLLNPAGEALLAYLQVRALVPSGAAPSSIEQRLADAIQKLQAQKLQPLEQPRRLSEDEDPRALAVKGWLGTFMARVKTPDGGSADVRLGFVDRSGAQFQLVGISPTLTDDPIAALRAQRTFEIVRETLRGTAPDR